MNALLIVLGIIIGIPLALYTGMVIFAAFGVTLAVVISVSDIQDVQEVQGA